MIPPENTRAILEGIARFEVSKLEILNRADLLTTGEAAELTGRTEEEILKLWMAGELVGLYGHGMFRLPRWQFHDGALLPYLGRIIAMWHGNHWASYLWLGSRAPGLGGQTPVDAILAGAGEDVLSVCQGTIECGYQ